MIIILTDARKLKLQKIAARDGEIIISKAARELGVSAETVRRDINALCEEKIFRKVHGGAVLAGNAVYEDVYTRRKETDAEIKTALGEYVCGLIQGTSVIFAAPGTTVEAVVSALDGKEKTVITNSLPAAENCGKNGASVTLLGGELNAAEHFTRGGKVREEISRFKADAAVISAVGVDAGGVMCSAAAEGDIIADMVKNARRTVLVVGSDKLCKSAVYLHTPLSAIDDCVTDGKNPVPEALKKAFAKNKVKLHIVK